MTRQEALDILTDNRVFTHACESTEEEQWQALDIAIKSLEAWDKIINEIKGYVVLLVNDSEYDSRATAGVECLNIINHYLREVEEK